MIRLGSLLLALVVTSNQLIERAHHCQEASQQRPLATPTVGGGGGGGGDAIRNVLKSTRSRLLSAPKMFEWRVFKDKFQKRFESALDEMVHMRRFLARSCDVIVMAVKYHNKQVGYYTTITERSDLLDEELAANRNKILAAEPDQDETAVRVEHGRGPKLERPKRDTSNYLSESDSDEYEGKFRSEIKERYASQKGFKLLDEMVAREGSRRDYTNLPVKSQHRTSGLGLALIRFLIGDRRPSLHEQQVLQQRPAQRTDNEDQNRDQSKDQGEDVVWVDHRRSGCLQPAGYQGQCGSCYAFAAIAFIEWAHCRETGHLVKFSEQYLMDCGSMTSDGIFSCDGARTLACGEFMANFGLELAQTYPYRARSSVCPYEPRTAVEAMGHLKVGHLDEVIKIELGLIEHHLERAPILIAIQCEGDFDFYAGGVFDGRKCRRKRRGDHAVLLVGHGREDGEEYWLIRNSYGAHWGDEGHIKLNKNSHCIWPPEGAIFGSSHLRSGGEKLDVVVNENMPKPYNMVRSPLAFALRTVPIG